MSGRPGFRAWYALAMRTYATAAEPDVPALVRLMRLAFAAGPESEQGWIRPSGLENFRVVRDGPGAAPSAGLLRIPMGQFFGGRSVPMLGIAGVVVAPEARGGGLARWMMGECVREAAAGGFPLSCLYASTHTLYRQVGYEEAGHRQVTVVPLHRIDCRSREPAVRALCPGDDAAVADCYRRFAARYAGTLDRGPYCWRRVREWRGAVYDGFGVPSPGDPGTLDGYVYFNQSRSEPAGQVGTVSDLAFLTPLAGRRLLALLADLGTMCREITVAGAPWPPVLSLMGGHRFDVRATEQWMLRVCDVRRALAERGYPRHVTAEFVLNVLDPLVPANEGAWTVRVEHGRAQVGKEASVRPGMSVTVGGLAAIYSGYASARQAAALGWAEGDPAALEAADAAFGGWGTPWMTDFF